MKSTKPQAKRRSVFPIVRLAAVKALGISDKYYGKADDSIMYRGAMRKFLLSASVSNSRLPVLDPRYRVTYLNKIGRQPEWIETAIELMRTQWITFYCVEDTADGSEVRGILLSCSECPV